ncbi:MAG: hypothetical protein GC158_15025 [Cyanobacteria bacterium RI_101]|nr:hypothetical protein [Cyanobacteria bacterium RI_101]
MINFKRLTLALASVAAIGVFTPVQATTPLGDLFDDTGTPAGELTIGDFTFSDFIISVDSGGVLNDWRAFHVTPTLSSGDPVLTFSGTLTTAGDYFVAYALTYTGTNPLPSRFFDITQSITGCTGGINEDAVTNNSGCTTDTLVYDDPDYVVGVTEEIGGVINANSNVFNKAAGSAPIYVDTAVFLRSGNYTGFSQTFDAQTVPWETDVLPLAAGTIIFGGAVWWKSRRGAKALDLGEGTTDSEQISDDR